VVRQKVGAGYLFRTIHTLIRLSGKPGLR